jgi:phosphonate transport system substrate-binding protein
MKKTVVFIILAILLILSLYILYHKEDRNTLSEMELRQFSGFEKGDYITLLRMPYANNFKIFDENYQLILYLSELFEKEVRLIVTRNYDEVRKIIDEDKADIIWTATNFYKKNTNSFRGYKVMVRPVTNGTDRYRGIIITHKESDIEKIGDLEGRTFAFTDVDSGSGYILPKKLLKDKYNIDINTFFKEVRFLYSHQKVIENVFYRKVDAGAVFEDAPSLFLKDRASSIRILDYTEYIINEPILVKEYLVERFSSKVLPKLLNDLPGNIKEELKIDGFVKAQEQDYSED